MEADVEFSMGVKEHPELETTMQRIAARVVQLQSTMVKGMADVVSATDKVDLRIVRIGEATQSLATACQSAIKELSAGIETSSAKIKLDLEKALQFSIDAPKSGSGSSAVGASIDLSKIDEALEFVGMLLEELGGKVDSSGTKIEMFAERAAKASNALDEFTKRLNDWRPPAAGSTGGASSGGSADNGEKAKEVIDEVGAHQEKQIEKTKAVEQTVVLWRQYSAEELAKFESQAVQERFEKAKKLEEEFRAFERENSKAASNEAEQRFIKEALARADAEARIAKNPTGISLPLKIPGLSKKIKVNKNNAKPTDARYIGHEKSKTVDVDGNDASDTSKRLAYYGRNKVAQSQQGDAPNQAKPDVEKIDIMHSIFGKTTEALNGLRDTIKERATSKLLALGDEAKSTAQDYVTEKVQGLLGAADSAIKSHIGEYVLQIGGVVQAVQMLPAGWTAGLATAGTSVAGFAAPVAAAAAAVASVGLVAVELKEIFSGTANQAGSVTDTIASWEVGLVDSLGQLTGAFDLVGNSATKAAEGRLAEARAEAAMRDEKESANKELNSKQSDQMSKLLFSQESKSMRANVAEGSRDSQADVERAISREARSGLDAAKRSIGSTDSNEQARGWLNAKLYADAIVDSQSRLVKLAQQEAQEREKSGA